MIKAKSTKRALLGSALALLVCVSMLIGSTFAWFTDSVTSKGNKIQAGTLKLDLELLDKETNTWNSIKESKAPIFDYDLWEPGYTDVKVLKVENEGTLALKWYAKFISANDLSILADVIDVYVCPSATELTYPADRNLDGYTKVGTVRDFVNTIESTTYGNLKANEVAYLSIALKMQESAGNEYQNKSLSAFDIMILATQNTVESDSFNNQYDENAEYPSFPDKWDATVDKTWFDADAAANATEENPVTFTVDNAEEFAGFVNLANTNSLKNVVVKLDCDIDMVGTNWNEGGAIAGYSPEFNGTLDGNGHTIYNLSAENNWTYANAIFRTIGKDVTIKNLNIEGANINNATGSSRNKQYAVLVGIVGGGTLNIENVTIRNSSIRAKDDVGILVGGMTEGAIYCKNVTIENCAVAVTTASGLGGAILGDGYSHHDYDYSGIYTDNVKVVNCTYTIAGVAQSELPLYNYVK